MERFPLAEMCIRDRNNIYSCRKIEKSLLRDIHFIWLAGYEKPDYRTINRFCLLYTSRCV